ncbi:uncharacterized protein [Bemisia tabaci]|uniref:uncharacterized protein n=1 Tax=Bemisia tabaci TaxID=7038 RepID=UPI003B27F9CE
MGRTCCVPDCRSNFSGNGPCVSTFRLPQNEARRNEWLKLIWREDLINNFTKHTVVCIKHFAPQHVITVDQIRTKDGLVSIPRKIPKLTEDAFPSIFPAWPSHYSVPVPPCRKNLESRAEEIQLAERRLALAQKREEIEADKIKNFNELKSQLVQRYTNFLTLPTETHVLFYKIQDDDIGSVPKVKISFKICVDFSVIVYQENEILPSKKLEKFLGSGLKCDMWSKLRCISQFLEPLNIRTEITPADQVKHFCESVHEILGTDHGLEEEKATKLEFLIEQLQLVFLTCVRYSPKMLVWAATMFYSHPGAYKAMRATKCLTLPYPGYLQQFLVKIGNNDPGLGPSQIAFLKEKFKLLQEDQKHVSIMLDEIYVIPRFSYKGGKIYGLAEESNEPNDVSAGTLQAFMYNSLQAKNKDVIALFPVRKLNGELLHKLTLQVLKVMEEVGFRVLAMSCDDNQVNVKMYKLLGNGKLEISIPHPFNPEERLFLLFDSVHLFKNCRNNWINAPEKVLKIPKIEWTSEKSFNIVDKDNLLDFSGLEDDLIGTEVETVDARFSNVIDLFNAEKNTVVKLAPRLNRKTVYPSSVERQNVKLVVNLFHDTTIAALETLKKDGAVTDAEGAINILKLFGCWWKISNVKTPVKGKRINDSWCEPIQNCGESEDWKLIFFRKFKEFLEYWHSLNIGGQLSAQTFTAFVHTIEATLNLCDYIFTSYGWDYILLGKLQTDGIEGRFGGYRRLSGSNYHVSVDQVCESERKLKLIGVLKLTSARGGDFSIKTFGDECQKAIKGLKVVENLEFFEPAITEAPSLDISVNDSRVLVCLASYSATKVIQHFSKTNTASSRKEGERKKICSNCIGELITTEPLEIERAAEIYEYMSAIDRGGLNKPSEFSFDLCVNIYKLFKILISQKYEDQFLKLQIPHKAVVDLGLQMFESYIDHLVPECGTCELKIVKVIKKMLRSMANCLLKNYTKNLQEWNTSRQLAMRLSKKAAREEKKKQKTSNIEDKENVEEGLKSVPNVVATGKVKDADQRKLVKLNPDRLGVSSNTQRNAVRKQVVPQNAVKPNTNQQGSLKVFKRAVVESSPPKVQPPKVMKVIVHQSKSSTIVVKGKPSVNPVAPVLQNSTQAQQTNADLMKRPILQSIENTQG